MINIYNIKNFDSRKLPRKFYQGLSTLLQDLGINGNDVVDDFIGHYVSHAYEKSKTKSSVYLNTGFSRYIVKKYLNRNQDYKKNKKKNIYYFLLLDELKKLSFKYDTGMIPVYGKFDSYTSAFDNTKSSENIITAKTMLDKLINAGIIEKIGSNIHFISSLQTKTMLDHDSVIEILANLMNRMSKTIYHNLKCHSFDDLFFQGSYLSYSINPNKHHLVIAGLNEMARRHFREYQEFIESHEDKDLTRQEVKDLNNEIGISTFVFNNDNEV